MNDWLRDAGAALSAVAGIEATDVSLSDDEARALLDLARVASHTSGDRTNAPLLCYLIGRIVERSPSATVAEMKDEVIRRAGGALP